MSTQEQIEKLERIKQINLKQKQERFRIAKLEEQMQRQKEAEFKKVQANCKKVLNKLPKNDEYHVKVTHPITKDVTSIYIAKGFIVAFDLKVNGKRFSFPFESDPTRIDAQGYIIYPIDPEVELYEALESSIDLVLDQILELYKKLGLE